VNFPPLKPDFPPGTLSIEPGVGGLLWVPRFRRQESPVRSPVREVSIVADLPEFNTDRAIDAQVAPAPDGTVWYPNLDSRTSTGSIQRRVTFVYPMYPDYHPEQAGAGIIIQFSYNKKPEGHFTYGVAADSKSKRLFLRYCGREHRRVDAKTGKVLCSKRRH